MRWWMSFSSSAVASWPRPFPRHPSKRHGIHCRCADTNHESVAMEGNNDDNKKGSMCPEEEEEEGANGSLIRSSHYFSLEKKLIGIRT